MYDPVETITDDEIALRWQAQVRSAPEDSNVDLNILVWVPTLSAIFGRRGSCASPAQSFQQRRRSMRTTARRRYGGRLGKRSSTGRCEVGPRVRRVRESCLTSTALPGPALLQQRRRPPLLTRTG